MSVQMQLAIVPPEVQELIFRKVGSPKDVLSCWNTSPVLHKALRTTDLYFKMTLPLVLPCLSGEDLLNCSAVSTFWNGAVDACIQEAEDFDISQNMMEHLCILTTVLHSYTTTDFLNTFALSPCIPEEDKVLRNPVPFRQVSVTLYLRPNEEHPEAEERERDLFAYDSTKMLKRLDYCGHLIRHLTVNISGEAVPSLKQVKFVRSCLERTPNLRFLRYDDSNAVHDIDQGDQLHSHNRWPALKHLTAFTSHSKTFASVASAYAPQLLSLQLSSALVENVGLFANRFSCLEKIVFRSYSSSAMEFGAFVQSSQCPLKHLTVVFLGTTVDTENINGVTMAANAASETLETLVLDPGLLNIAVSDSDFSQFGDLRLPRLKELKLTGFGFPSLETLERICPALQTLTVKPIFSNNPNQGAEMRDSQQMYNDLYSEHRFWKTLERIECVVVDYQYDIVYRRNNLQQWDNGLEECPEEKLRTVFTREEYKAAMKNGNQE